MSIGIFTQSLEMCETSLEMLIVLLFCYEYYTHIFSYFKSHSSH